MSLPIYVEYKFSCVIKIQFKLSRINDYFNKRAENLFWGLFEIMLKPAQPAQKKRRLHFRFISLLLIGTHKNEIKWYC